MRLRSALTCRLKALAKGPNIPRFIYVYGVDYAFPEINAKESKEAKKTEEPLDLKELVQVFRANYENSLLCLLLMKPGEGEVAGQFIPIVNFSFCV